MILGFILGSLLSRAITGHAAITDTAIATAALVFIHWALTAIGCRWRHLNGIKGHTYPIVSHGRVVTENMLRSHVSRGDLAEAMRMQGVEDLGQVDSAYKERNGELSVITHNHAD